LASSATPVAVSGAGDYAFYLGFASTDGSSFSTATLSIGDGVSLLPVAVDDVTLAAPGNRVPEPGSLLLACSALGLAWVRARPLPLMSRVSIQQPEGVRHAASFKHFLASAALAVMVAGQSGMVSAGASRLSEKSCVRRSTLRRPGGRR
jgi:hypothetical protein